MKYAVVLLALCINYVFANKVRREVCTSKADCMDTVCVTGKTVVCQHPDMNNPRSNGGLCTCENSDSAPSNNPHLLVPITSNEFDCTTRKDDYYASPYECSTYYICMAGMGFRTHCHPGLVFNEQTLFCDYPDHVTCSASGGGTTTHASTTIRAPIPSTCTNFGGPVNSANFCKGKPDGFYKDPMDCSHFYQCSFEISFHEPCPFGTYFSENLQGCDWAVNVHNCP